jgi:hypothetical protein
VLIQGNVIFHNYGEGLGTRGINITIRGNTVFDNFSANIYTNSEHAVIDKNLVYCTPNSGYERKGKPGSGIALGEEYFAGWGARLKYAQVTNNIVAYCKNGVRYEGPEAGVVGGGLKYSRIIYNTLYGTLEAPLSIMYGSAQAGNLIANNIIWHTDNNRLASIESGAGLTFQNNLWKALPPLVARGPGDKIGDPGFISGSPGYAPNDFRPGSGSRAAGGAVNLNILKDYFWQIRGPSFDIGAVQSGTGSDTIPAPVSQEASPEPMEPLQPAEAPGMDLSMSQPTQEAQTTIQVVEVTHDDASAAFSRIGPWQQIVKKAAYSGSFLQTSHDGASLSLEFSGQAFSILYKGGPGYGKMQVYVDGAGVGTIDQYSARSQYGLRWDSPAELALGAHTLRLVFLATHSNARGSLDAVLVH